MRSLVSAKHNRARGGMMGRMMAFIVVVVCTAQVVLLRAQEPSAHRSARARHLNPRFAYHRIDDGYLRLDLRSGEVATCRPCQRLDLHARRPRNVLRSKTRSHDCSATMRSEERVARARPGAALVAGHTSLRRRPTRRRARRRRSRRQADAGEHRQAEVDRIVATWSAGGAASSSWWPRSSVISKARIKAKD